MFLDIYFHSPLKVDRDGIEDALEEYLGDQGEVVGAGTGSHGSNIDLDIDGDAHKYLEPIKKVLRRFRVPTDTQIVINRTRYPVYD